ncbi:thioredoxin domain-containing protein [Candidatus Peregrinibacteria bacterium]|nr:thioredoxin domain-containing protein [Candidatus Peregrinibacteria bacterium]
MKTFYSSTFLTVVLAFLALLGRTGTPVVIVQNAPTPAFQTIIEPIGPALEAEEGSKVKVEIFNTFDCQSCNSFGQGILPQLVEKYGGDDHVDMHLFLIPNRASEAELYATRGAYCAAKYNLFWDMIYKMHATEELSKREVDLLGQELGLPILEFRSCLDSEEFDETIGRDIAYAQVRQISYVPVIFVNDTLLLGAQPVENIERVINKYLNN